MSPTISSTCARDSASCKAKPHYRHNSPERTPPPSRQTCKAKPDYRHTQPGEDPTPLKADLRGYLLFQLFGCQVLLQRTDGWLICFTTMIERLVRGAVGALSDGLERGHTRSDTVHTSKGAAVVPRWHQQSWRILKGIFQHDCVFDADVAVGPPFVIGVGLVYLLDHIHTLHHLAGVSNLQQVSPRLCT